MKTYVSAVEAMGAWDTVVKESRTMVPPRRNPDERYQVDDDCFVIPMIEGWRGRYAPQEFVRRMGAYLMCDWRAFRDVITAPSITGNAWDETVSAAYVCIRYQVPWLDDVADAGPDSADYWHSWQWVVDNCYMSDLRGRRWRITDDGEFGIAMFIPYDEVFNDEFAS